MTTFNFPPNLFQITRMIGELQTLASLQQHETFAARAEETLGLLDQCELFQRIPHRPEVLRDVRSLLTRPETRSDGLGTLDRLVRALADPPAPPDVRSEFARITKITKITRPIEISIPSFWRYAAMSTSGPQDPQGGPKPATLAEWREAIGSILFQKLRHEHVLLAHEGGTGFLILRVNFDPMTGKIHQIEASERGRLFSFSPYGRAANVFVTYDYNTRRLSLDEKLSGRAVVDTRLEEGYLSREIVALVESLENQRPIFPAPKIRRQTVGTGSLVEIDPSIFQENVSYAQTALAKMRIGAIPFNRGVLSRADPALSVSVASDGSFVGFTYWLPTASESVYEVGVPGLGTLAQITYDLYRNSSHGLIRLPVGFKWNKMPNAFQKTAVRKWRSAVEYRVKSEKGWELLPRTR